MVGPEILLVEDDDAIASGLARVLEAEGHGVVRLALGLPAVAAAANPSTRLVLLDLGLPDVDGITVCRRLREARPEMAIIVVTARHEELDIVAGLDAGADDYLVKPFRLAELLARVRAHLRRTVPTTDDAASNPDVFEVGNLRIDRGSRRAFRGEQELTLRPKEFELLTVLAAEAGRAITREHLMREVWHTDWMGSTKTLDTHVFSLRRQIGADAITTLRGVGYRLEAP